MGQVLDEEAKKAAAEAVALLGGPVAAARKLEVEKYQTVQSWVSNGIPARYCVRVFTLTGVTLQRLRPADWHDYWPSGKAVDDQVIAAA